MCKVSIIVPNYNHSSFLKQRLDSIFNQTYQDFEVILMDDCSTDNSRDILEQYRDHQKVSHVIFNTENSGTSYKQWYKGIEYAKGELIWIAESDDWSDERFLEILLTHFEDQRVSLVYSQTEYIEEYSTPSIQEELTEAFSKFDGNTFIAEQMLSGNKIPNASMVVFRRDIYNEVKNLGFKDLKLSGDFLLWIEIMKNHSIVSVTDKLNFCRRHDQNATNKFRKKGLDFIEGLAVLKKGKKYCNNKFDKKNVYIKWWDYYNQFKKYFDPNVNKKILFKFLNDEPMMFLYFVKKIIIRKISSIFT